MLHIKEFPRAATYAAVLTFPLRREMSTLAAGPGAARGRTRTVNINENDTYLPLSLEISGRMRHRRRLAVASSDMSQLEFIVRALEPAIDEALSSRGIEMDGD